MESVYSKIRRTAQRQSVFRARDVAGVVDPRSALRRMVERGELTRTGRGLYTLPDAEIGASHALVLATQRYPGCVVCLISALVFHGLGTQMPYETWLARSDRRPARPAGEPVRFVYSTGPAFSYGIEEHRIEGVTVRVYSPAKTVADCFKYRNKIGLDVAIEGLRAGWRERRFTSDALWAAAKVCRVQRVMQPYLEMVVQ